ncbi:hypothetical protein [Microbispora sp. H10949]|nr:hypothetical protein [Microbispora sp. H10949]
MESDDEFAQWISLLREDEAFDAEVDRLGAEGRCVPVIDSV